MAVYDADLWFDCFAGYPRSVGNVKIKVKVFRNSDCGILSIKTKTIFS